jgi:hypothetical protein
MYTKGVQKQYVHLLHTLVYKLVPTFILHQVCTPFVHPKRTRVCCHHKMIRVSMRLATCFHPSRHKKPLRQSADLILENFICKKTL